MELPAFYYTVLGITTAYESGVGDGQANRTDKINPYEADTPEHLAYQFGRRQGEEGKSAYQQLLQANKNLAIQNEMLTREKGAG